jgi:polar amino acid transport system permease protein
MFDLLPQLLSGAVVTVSVAAVAAVFGTLMSVVAAFGRLSRRGLLRAAATVYVEFFRGTSLFVQLFWMFFVLPHFGVLLDPFLVAVLALGLNNGAYGSEVVRGAILAVPREQHEAAIALNMSPWLRIRRVVLPQAVTIMLLPWGNLLIILLKSTALVSLISIQDLAFKAYNLNVQTFRTLTLFGLTLLLYFLMAQVIATGVGLLYRRMSRGLVRGHA